MEKRTQMAQMDADGRRWTQMKERQPMFQKARTDFL
jgi:hypothetical protein